MLNSPKKCKRNPDGSVTALEDVFEGDLIILESESAPESTKDKGQLELEKDIVALLNDVRSYEFHDFKNSAYSLPKVALGERLHALRLKAIEGGYDN